MKIDGSEQTPDTSSTYPDFSRIGLDQLLTVEEIAIYTRTSRQTVWREIRAKRLKARKFGRSLRVSASELRSWADSYNSDQI